MATHLLESGAFLDNWVGRPVLVLTGKANERVPYEYVQRHVKLLQEAGVRVTEIVYPDEDHFLFFSRPEDILDDTSEWLLHNQGQQFYPDLCDSQTAFQLYQL